MAHRKRKGRQAGNRQRASQPKSKAMLPQEPPVSLSTRPSTDGALSEFTTISDDPTTAVTSIVDPDEEMPDVHEAQEQGNDSDNEAVILIDDGEDSADMETRSLHPRHRLQTSSDTHRASGHFNPEGSSVVRPNDLASSTRSLWALDLDYREIHGRRYCREYYMPNDDIEQLRLTLQHQVILSILDGEVTLVDLLEPTHILDVGTGTGEWAIKIAEQFPNCEVIGTDISAIAETQSVPINVFFEIEDAEDWDRPPDLYDLVHFRWMQGAFRDWSFVYESSFYSLKPGGWIEIQDFDSTAELASFFSIFPPESPMHALFRDVDIAAEKTGRGRGVEHLDPLMLMNAGFVDVTSTEYIIPITLADNSVGKLWLISCLEGIEAICLRLLTEQMGWDPDECKAACQEAAMELANLARDPETAMELVIKLRVIVGRKPLDAKPTAAPWPAPYSVTSQPAREETPSAEATNSEL